METSYSAFGASSQLAKNQLNSQQRFACCCRFTRLIDHGHGTRASPWRPLTREENFYIAFPTSLDCLSPPFPPHVGGDGRTRTARGRCLDFVTRLGKQRRRPLPCTAKLCSAAVSLRPLAIKAEWRVTSHLKRRRNLLLFSTSWRPRSNFVAVCESTLQHSSRQVGKCHKSRGRRVRLSCFLSAVLTPPYSLPPFPESLSSFFT